MILAAALVVAIASPALGATECLTFDIGHTEDGSPFRADSLEFIETINTAIVGDYLWVQPDDGARVDELDGTVSVEIGANTIGAEVCADGKVTLISAAAPNIGTALTMVDLVEVWGFEPIIDTITGPK